jgi:hypothetical protein
MYEPDIKNRAGIDFRKNRTAYINSKKDIEYDMQTIDHCLVEQEIECGYFVYVNEAKKFEEFSSEANGFKKYSGDIVLVYKRP